MNIRYQITESLNICITALVAVKDEIGPATYWTIFAIDFLECMINIVGLLLYIPLVVALHKSKTLHFNLSVIVTYSMSSVAMFEACELTFFPYKVNLIDVTGVLSKDLMLVISSTLHNVHVGNCVVIVTAMIMERFCATLFIHDYEFAVCWMAVPIAPIVSRLQQGKSAQQNVDAENINEFVTYNSTTGKAKLHNDHEKIKRKERHIISFMKNADKNRFLNAVLFNEGAICLESTTKNKKEENEYIHATRIATKFGTYALAQAPKEETLLDWCRMIWQIKAKVIACLVDPANKDECAHYFDKKEGHKVKIKGRFKIRTIAVRPDPVEEKIVCYELRIINNNEKGEDKERVLHVVCVLGWNPEQPFPPRTLVAAIRAVLATEQSMAALSPGPPDEKKEASILVHGCSGIRRTGVFTLGCIFAKQMSTTKEISFISTIDKVRMLRYGVLRQKIMFYLLLEVIFILAVENGLIQKSNSQYHKALDIVRKGYPKKENNSDEDDSDRKSSGEKKKSRKK